MVGNHILCFQGHPEYTKQYAQHVLEKAKGKDAELIRKAMESLQLQTAQGATIARWILNLN